MDRADAISTPEPYTPSRPTRLLVTRVVENLKVILEEPPVPRADRPLPDISGYEILQELGEGGMGVVYKARHLALKRLVALKMIAPNHSGATSSSRFRTEAETVARLHHPHIVQIYEVGEHEGRPYLALELVEGETLAALLAKQGQLPARDAVQLVAILAHAIHHAHQKGVVHRDLKPGNILISDLGIRESDQMEDAGLDHRSATISGLCALPCAVGNPKISDFGLAKLLDENQSRTRNGTILGTPAYMAPEQAGNGATIGPATDVYALGAILFECLTGRLPFVGDTSWDVIYQVVNTDPVPPSHWRPRLARDLDTICLKAMTKDPARRYASAKMLADDLDRFAAGEAISARPDGRLQKITRRIRKRPVAVAASLLVAGAVSLGGLFWQGRIMEAETDLIQGRNLLEGRAYAEALARFEAGANRLNYVPYAKKLHKELDRERSVVDLRILADSLRFQIDPNDMTARERAHWVTNCRDIWMAHNDFLPDVRNHPNWESQIRNDLLDIGLIELQLDGSLTTDHSAALARLEELADLIGTNPALIYERNERLIKLGRSGEANQLVLPVPTTATDCQRLGRALRRDRRLDEAAAEFDRGLRFDPKALFLHYDRAKCAIDRKRFDDAIQSLTACIALTPKESSGACYALRASAYLARAETTGDEDRRAAEFDLDIALARDQNLPEAWYGRGRLHGMKKDFPAAIAAFRAALDRGYPPAKGYYNLAIVQVDAHHWDDAKTSLRRALEADPNYAQAKDLLARIEH